MHQICKICKNNKICKYKEKTEEYIEKIKNIKQEGIYGTITYKCDYYIKDEPTEKHINFMEYYNNSNN